jgi:hypothetical protein
LLSSLTDSSPQSRNLAAPATASFVQLVLSAHACGRVSPLKLKSLRDHDGPCIQHIV